MFISLVQNAYTCKYTRLTFGARFVLLMLYCLGGIARSCVRKYGVPKQQLNKLHIRVRTWIIYNISVGDTMNLMDNVFLAYFAVIRIQILLVLIGKNFYTYKTVTAALTRVSVF